ncbi:MAG TPA: hypothetical protein VN631_02420 [Negativicutes bacterium]|nr:hypothetical protein [Negativicutes bacterium]
MAAWLGNLAKAAHQKFYVLALVLVLAVTALVMSDQSAHWIERIIPFERIGKVGESIGETAFFLGFVATLYYGVRDAFVTARKMHAPIPAWLDSLAKYWITVLRLAHPLLGVLVFSVVLLHGYVMWQIWAAGNFSFAVETGLTAAAIMVMVALSGLFIRWMPKLTKLRYVHRLVGILFVLSFIVHRIVAD